MAEDKKGAAQSAPKSDNKEDQTPTLQEQLDTLQVELGKKDEEILELQKQASELQEELTDAAEIIEELKEKGKSGDKEATSIVKIGGKKYQIVGGFRTKDRVYTPEDIQADSNLLKTLIEKRSGLIREVV